MRVRSYDAVHALPALRGVKEDTLRDMENKGRVLSLHKGDLLFRAGERCDFVYFLLDGQAIVYTLTRSGHRKIIFIFGGGALLNDSVLGDTRNTVFAETISDCRVFSIRTADFSMLMEKDFSLVRAMFRIQERKLWRTGHQLKNTMGSIFLEKKLAAKLWKLARDFGEPDEKEAGRVVIQIPMSITFLADLLGAPRETTSRVCKILTDRKLISIDKKTITVLCMDCLAAFYKSYCRKLDTDCESCHVLKADKASLDVKQQR